MVTSGYLFSQVTPKEKTNVLIGMGEIRNLPPLPHGFQGVITTGLFFWFAYAALSSRLFDLFGVLLKQEPLAYKIVHCMGNLANVGAVVRVALLNRGAGIACGKPLGFGLGKWEIHTCAAASLILGMSRGP